VRTPPCAGRPRVLVIEDSGDTRESLCLLFSLSGCDVRGAADGEEGLRLALGWRPDAIVSDIGLPGLDGWQVARRVREALGQAVLLVALTGYGHDEDRRRSLEAGFDHHLAKPAAGPRNCSPCWGRSPEPPPAGPGRRAAPVVGSFAPRLAPASLAPTAPPNEGRPHERYTRPARDTGRR
jgi:CheY-like chemotaxis protein